MSLDDAARVQRLRAAPRTDRPLGDRMHAFCEALQTRLCTTLERLDGGSAARFSRDAWERPVGVTRVLEGGAVFAKAVVAVSAVHGDLSERGAEGLGAAPQPFFAAGLSLVVHAVNPYVPGVHADFHYVRLGADPFAPADQWFGGEAGLVPVYPFREDAEAFHRVWKAVCDRHAVADYRRFKASCDAAFYLPRREETLGVGGIAFDHLREDPEGAFHFVREAGRAFLSAYVPLVEARKDAPWGEREAAFQRLRRGRYAESDLAGGGLESGGFEIETGGRAERLVMGLPPTVARPVARRPTPGSPEADALRFFQPHDWLGLEEI